MAETAIVYGNRYRVTNKEVDFGLSKAESAFLKGNFKSSLENAISAINIVEPGIHKNCQKNLKIKEVIFLIYLDYSATTPVDIDVFDTLSKVTKNYIGNPNSMHSLGQKSMELLESATKQIADIFGVSSNEIVYTGGSTESNNMAIIGAALANHKKENI